MPGSQSSLMKNVPVYSVGCCCFCIPLEWDGDEAVGFLQGLRATFLTVHLILALGFW